MLLAQTLHSPGFDPIILRHSSLEENSVLKKSYKRNKNYLGRNVRSCLQSFMKVQLSSSTINQ